MKQKTKRKRRLFGGLCDWLCGWVAVCFQLRSLAVLWPCSPWEKRLRTPHHQQVQIDSQGVHDGHLVLLGT